MADRSHTELFDEIEGHGFTDALDHPIEAFVPWTELRRRVEDVRDHAYTVEDGWIELYSGTQFRYRNVHEDMILPVDLAEALSKVCRYAGHVHTFYSVAEHSCLLMRWARKRMPELTRQELRTLLLHDAAEAYIPDLPRPLKHMMPAFKALEHDLETVIASKFDLVFPFPAFVKDLDTRILRDEREQALNPSDNEWGTDHFEPLGLKLHFWDPAEAADNFLGDLEELTP